jgi:hypothetical protein
MLADDDELLEWIKAVVSVGNFRVRPHATRHMFKEGILERNMIEAVTGKSRILEHYPDESRCLVTGYFQISENVRSPLHLVFEYSREDEDAVDIVTAYIPQKPWWITPWQRSKSK